MAFGSMTDRGEPFRALLARAWADESGDAPPAPPAAPDEPPSPERSPTRPDRPEPLKSLRSEERAIPEELSREEDLEDEGFLGADFEPTLDDLDEHTPTAPGHEGAADDLLRALDSMDVSLDGFDDMSGEGAGDDPDVLDEVTVPLARLTALEPLAGAASTRDLPVSVGLPTAYYSRSETGELRALRVPSPGESPDDEDPFAQVPDAPLLDEQRLSHEPVAEQDPSLDISIEVLHEARARDADASRARLLTPLAQVVDPTLPRPSTTQPGRHARDLYRAALEALAQQRRGEALVHARLAVAYDPADASYRALVSDLETLVTAGAPDLPLPVVRGRLL